MRVLLAFILGIVLATGASVLADHSGTTFNYDPSGSLQRSQQQQELNDTLQRGPYTAPYSPYTSPSFRGPC